MPPTNHPDSEQNDQNSDNAAALRAERAATARRTPSFYERLSGRERGAFCASIMCAILLAILIAGFVVAGQQGDLQQQCPSEFNRVNSSSQQEAASFASNLPPSKWLYVYSGTSIAEFILFVAYLVAQSKSGGDFYRLSLTRLAFLHLAHF